MNWDLQRLCKENNLIYIFCNYIKYFNTLDLEGYSGRHLIIIFSFKAELIILMPLLADLIV